MAEGETLAGLKEVYGAGQEVMIPGLKIHYARKGHGQPLILLHGWPEFWLTFRRNIDVLAEDFDVIVPDIRGFGESRSTDRPVDVPLTAKQIADDLAGFLDTVGVKQRIGIVTHDVGSVAAQTFARSYPERLAGLFFFNAPHPGIGRRWAAAETIPEIWYQTFHQLPIAPKLVGASRETCEAYFGYQMAHWSHDPHLFDADLHLWIDNFMAPGALEGGFAYYKGIAESRLEMIRNGPPRLPKIGHPTRVLWGGSDPILRPEWIDNLGDTFSNLYADVLPKAGHFVHYEAAERANREIHSFFKNEVWRG